MPLSDYSFKRLYQITALLTGIIAAFYFSYIFLDIILMLSISILIALIFNPFVNQIDKLGIKRIYSVLIAFGVSIVSVVLGFSVLIPKIIRQFNTLSKTFNQETVAGSITQLEAEINAYLPFINTSNFTSQLSQFISSLFFTSIDNFTQIISSIFSVLSISIIVPFMTFFLLKDNKKIINGIINIMPNRYFEMSYSVVQKIIYGLGRFVRGWIFDAFLVGFLSAAGLTILGIDNSISIGLIAGVGHLIPYFGPLIGGLPAIIISLMQFGDFSMFPQILIMFLIIYTFDNGFIQPNIFSKTTDMHPLLIILLILIGSKILGVIGMLLAVPVATVVKSATKEIYVGYKNYKIIKTS
ncbi:MAG: AI-2E family transporter [Melioribacteraceae bacterium]|nr:AI-2E family transporter [Melioribacteraceae bacterium]